MTEKKTWSGHPFAPEMSRTSLRLGDESLGEGGESIGVREIVAPSGWVAKLYKSPLPAAEADTLAELIDLPDRMSEEERGLVDRSMAWPVSRITDEHGTIGVIMARIPETFYVRFSYGQGKRTEPRELQLDHLVMADVRLTKLGLELPSPARRQAIAARFLSLGALLERHDVVYGDWSYSNALWSRHDDDVFLIDLDPCGLKSRKWIRSHHWEDPLFPQGTPLATGTDRYRMALLVLRVLTGVRGDPRHALEQLEKQWSGDTELLVLLSRAVTTTQVSERPTVASLLSALEGRPTPRQAARPADSGVVGWRPVSPPRPSAQQKPTASRPKPTASRPKPTANRPKPTANRPKPTPARSKPEAPQPPRVQPTAQPAVPSSAASCLWLLLLLAGLATALYFTFR